MGREKAGKALGVDSRMPRAWRAVVTAGVLVAIAAQFLSPQTGVRSATYAGTICLAAVLAWAGIAGAPRIARPGLGLIATGVTLNAVADVVWLWIFHSTGVDPDVSIADIGYFASYLCLGVALLIALFVGAGMQLELEGIIDALTIVVVSVLILWSLTIGAIVADTTVSPFVRGVWAAYPVVDAVLLALVLRVMVRRHLRQMVGVSFGIGVTLWLVADISYLVSPATDLNTALQDTSWMIAAMMMAQASWRPLDAAPTLEALAEDQITGRARLAIAILPLLVPPALAVHNELTGGDDSPWLPVVGTLLLLGLAYTRTSRLLRSESTARAEARASHRHYQRLAANSSDAILVVDAGGRITEPSPQLGRLVGAVGTAETYSWIEALRPADPAELDDLLARALDRPGTVVSAEVEVGGPGSAAAWVRVRLVNLLDDPDVHGIVAALSDVTAEKAFEAELAEARDAALQASRAKSAFLANMSHEIRTPMNGVIGLAALLRTTPLDERQAQYAEGIRNAGDGLLRIINDILDFSKVEAGAVMLECIDFDLAQLVEEVGELVADPALSKGLELLAYCSPELPRAMRGDPARLRQVLLNLASNAVKFTPAGEVVISARLEVESEDGITALFEVTDTGIGVDEADLEHLFAPFSQADSSTTRRYGGTGLGLAICRQLVGAMGGELGVDSEPGAGSRFWFRLRLQRAADPSAIVDTGAEPLTGTRALVVDDNQTNRLILTDQLAAWGVEVEAVDSALPALERLGAAAAAGTPFHVVLLDLCMPDIDGLELARRISAAPGLPPVGKVLLTSGPDVPAEQAEGAGIGVRLTKPLRLAHLHAAIHQVRRSPPREAAAPAPARPPEDGEPRPLRGRVLVVEDNQVNQLVAVGILEHLGYRVEVAANGLEAMIAVAGTEYDAVLMDCQMPEMDGFEATAELRRMEGGDHHTPVIAMTAGAVEGDRERCLAAGMDDYVAKPVTPDDIDAALARWVPQREPA